MYYMKQVIDRQRDKVVFTTQHVVPTRSKYLSSIRCTKIQTWKAAPSQEISVVAGRVEDFMKCGYCYDAKTDMAKKRHGCYRTRRLITVFTTARHRTFS
jgi:hypothetical protein